MKRKTLAMEADKIVITAEYILERALFYAKQYDWHVFPLSHNSKMPRKGSHGCLDASNVPEQIRQLWAKYPDHKGRPLGIGVATGPSDLFVIDLDMKKDDAGEWEKNGYQEWIHLLERLGVAAPFTVMTETPRGGWHLFFKGTADASEDGLLAPAIDVKSKGGYVIVAPTMVNFKYYSELAKHEYHTKIAPLRAWLLDEYNRKLDEKKTHIPDSSHSSDVVDSPQQGSETGLIQYGDRHSAVRSHTMDMANAMGMGVSAEQVFGFGLEFYENRCVKDPPMTEKSIWGLAKSAADKAYMHPTDMGMAAKFNRMFGTIVLWTDQQKSWYVWNKRIWEPDAIKSVNRLANAVVRDLRAIAVGVIDKDQRKKSKSFANSRQNATAINRMLSLVQADVAIRMQEFDTHDYLLTCGNGTIDLKTGVLRPHDPEQMLTKLIPWNYVPGATCPEWLKFLDWVTCGDAELQTYLRDMIGYSLTASIGEQVWFGVQGEANAGKTTFFQIMAKLMGPFALPVKPELFLAKNKSRNPNEHTAAEMALRGRRFVYTPEPPKGKLLDEELMKAITGGAPMSGRVSHGRTQETFPITFKIWMDANDLPHVLDQSVATWRRIRRIPFNAVVDPDNQREQSELVNSFDYGGILAWAVAGAVLWYNTPGVYPVPACIQVATEGYQAEEDGVGQWLKEHTVVTPEGREPAKALHESYVLFCDRNGLPKSSQRLLTRTLGKKGFDRGGRNGAFVLGLSFAQTAPLRIGFDRLEPEEWERQRDLGVML